MLNTKIEYKLHSHGDKLRFPPDTSPIHFIDVDIKKECIKYSGEWDICVHKDAQNKFSWWKDGKYVGS